MSKKQLSRAHSIASKSGELGLVAPQVIAIRLGRMMLAGNSPSAKDKAEMHRMGAEKSAAFQQAWMAMYLQGLRMNQTLMLSMTRSLWTWPWSLNKPAQLGPLLNQIGRGTLAMMDQGLRPIHATASANLRRLSAGK